MSRELLKRATDAQVRYERAELAAADKRVLRDKAIREARAEHPAARIAQATGLSRERVRQIAKLTLALVAVLAVLALPAVASAYPFLPKAQAERDTTTVALRSAHRIWRVSDTRIEHMGCKRFDSSIELCYTTVGLHYSADECVPPVEVSALFIIGQASRTEYVWRQNKPWEVDPAGAGGCLPSASEQKENEEAEHQLEAEVAKVYREGEEAAAKAEGR